MTEREHRVLMFIVAAYQDGGPLPTLRAICAEMGWTSTNAASEVLAKLTRLGALRRTVGTKSYGVNLEHGSVRELRRAS